ncbi:MAG: TrkH family potassium uptake protein [Lachnospiraceae bacterium]|nr:TrkH family potassium uptake protein [Lachnospiraceae bacterium]
MNYSMIRYILGSVLSFEGIFLLLPVLVGAFYGEKEALLYFIVAFFGSLLGFLGRLKKPKDTAFYAKEGFAAVSLSWLVLSLVGALPMFLTKEFPSYADALFETISGFTTTGASVLSSVEELSHCTAFWRCFTHWIGGMGVLVFIMAVLPLSGNSSMYLMRAESPGPSVGKLVPSVKRTAMILYGIYVAITVGEVISLLLAGMPLFDAVTLSFSTAGTGGFGLLNSSIASYSLAVQIIITIFMLLCSVNFNVYYLLLTRRVKEAFFNEEVRCFFVIVFTSAILITINIKYQFSNLFEAFHAALFQVASIISTTGFATVDFDLWPEFSKTVLVFLMFIGACACSTGGGFKVSRLLIIVRSLKNEVMAVTHPRSVQKVHMDGRGLNDGMVKNVLCYLSAYFIILVTSVLLLSLNERDLTTNLTAVLATLNNVGPGLSGVGPTKNFGSFDLFSKIVLMFDMLAGRLEIFPVLVLLEPGLWKVRKSR